MKTSCCLCGAALESERSAILTMGGFATPRYICDGCGDDIDTASISRTPDEADAAMDRISKKMAKNNVDDGAVLKTVEEIMAAAADRAAKIRAGEYDFSEEDEAELAAPADEEIPEELRETEEDRARDEHDAAVNKKLDKITNWVCLAVLLAALGFVAYRIIATYFL